MIPDEIKKHQGSDFKIREDSIKTSRSMGSRRSDISPTWPRAETGRRYYDVWIRTEGTLIEFTASSSQRAIFR